MDTKTNLAEVLTDFANLQRSVEAIARFQKKWPDFLPSSPPPRQGGGVHVEPPQIQIRKASGEIIPLIDSSWPEDQQRIVGLQLIVQMMWSGRSESWLTKQLEGILLTGELAFNSDMPILQHLNTPQLPEIFSIDTRRGVFVYKPQTPLQEALYYLLQNSSLAKICANREDCPAPYFIARRSNVQYCSEDCLQYKQRESKRAWWGEKGEQWREGRQKKSKSVRRKK
jgi:hypothetical protein